MINAINNIYQSENLNGEFLTRPLKVYHTFMVKKIELASKNTHERSEFTKLFTLASIVAYIVVAIFAYPVLSILAAIGILTKLTGIPGLKKHNESAKKHVEGTCQGIKHTKGLYIENSSDSVSQSGWKMSAIREFKITKQNVDQLSDTIKQEIDLLTRQMKKIYFSTQGIIDNDAGEIVLQLRIRERI